MSPRLEERYVVLKLKDLSQYQQQGLREFLENYSLEKKTIDCVVVEHDWPIYPDVVNQVLSL